MTKFVIGIGSQRAGSTLLHKILDEATDVFMHPVKELHYYDTLYDVRSPDVLVDYSRRQLDRELDRLVSSKAFGYIDKKYRSFIRANKILANTPVSQVSYLDLYRPCVNDYNYLGEITPEYMVLPEEGVAHLARDVGSDAKIILISRDPVERFISAFKLLKNYSNPEYDSENFSHDLDEVLKSMPKWVEQQEQLNDYEAAVNKYSKYFDSILFLSFEKMVSDSDLLSCQLEDFLGLDVDKTKVSDILSNKVNAIGNTGDVSTEIISELSARFLTNNEYLSAVFK